MKSLDQVESRTPISRVPFTVTRGGSYYLTTNLSAGVGEDGIVVDGDGVTIDLNGFSLTGSGLDSGSGIRQKSGSGLSVHNGVLSSWRGADNGGIRAVGGDCQVVRIRVRNCLDGIHAGGEGSHVLYCSVYDCDRDGIYVGPGGTVNACTASSNGRDGIRAGDGCMVSDCATYENVEDGIHVGEGTTVSRCGVKNNHEDGIDAGYGCTLTQCTVAENWRDGIHAPYHSRISRCIAYRNGRDGIGANGYGTAVLDCVSRLNDDDGIVVGYKSRVTGNSSGDNAQDTADGAGIQVNGEDSHVENNTIQNNQRGLHIATSNSVVSHNAVWGNADNYEIDPGNQLELLLCEVPETVEWPCLVRLAGTLICSETGTNGITIDADDVTIDLDGHALQGPGVGSGHGIYQTAAHSNLCLCNGSVVEWQGAFKSGVYAAGGNNGISGVSAHRNRDGILCGRQGRITAVSACANAYDGIFASNHGALSDCHAHGNGYRGVWVIDYTTVTRCYAHTNVLDGIHADGFCHVTDSAFSANGRATSGAGIRVSGTGSQMDGNGLNRNVYGIQVEDLSYHNVILRNVARGSRRGHYELRTSNSGPVSTEPHMEASPYANFEFTVPVP